MDTKTHQHRRVALDPETGTLLAGHRCRCEARARAATSLFTRLPARPEGMMDQAPQRADATYERIAAELRAQIASGELSVGAPLPIDKQLAEQYEISVGTAHRVTALLACEGLVEVSRGRRATVIHQPSTAAAEQLSDTAEAVSPPQPSDVVPLDRRSEQTGQLADPTDPQELRQLLVDAIKRGGQDESQIAEYEMDIRHFGESPVLTTFVATAR